MPLTTGFGSENAIPHINTETCINCGLCAKLCGDNPLSMIDGKVGFQPNPMWGCMGCGQCMAACPTGSVTVTGRNLLPSDRIPLPAKDLRATPEQLESLLQARRSIRRFAPREVEREKVERILEIASQAPMGLPPSDVEVLVWHGLAKVRELFTELIGLYDGMRKYFKPPYVSLMKPFVSKVNYDMFSGFLGPYADRLAEEFRAGRDGLFYDAPLAMLFHSSPYADPADNHIAATYAMLAAESLGLGTIMIGAAASMLQRNKKLLEKYRIPKGNKFGLVLCIGYPQHHYKWGLKRRFAKVNYA